MSFFDFLFGLEDGLEPEMRPERVFGILAALNLVVRVASKVKALPASAMESAAPLTAGCSETRKVSTMVTRTLSPAELRRFLRSLADSIGDDTPDLNIEVISEDGDFEAVKEPARRLAAKAFA